MFIKKFSYLKLKINEGYLPFNKNHLKRKTKNACEKRNEFIF